MSERRPVPPHHAHCLGCGPDNPASLGLELWIEDERVTGLVTFDERHQGAPGFVHGGAVATALDDALGHLLVMVGRPAVTAKLEVNYRRPAFLRRRFDVEAWLEQTDGRKIHMAAEMRDSGELIADSSAVYVAVDREHFLQGADQLPW